MKTTFIANGKLSIVLTPETEIEKLLLEDLFSKQSVETYCFQNAQIIDKNVADSVVISAKKETV